MGNDFVCAPPRLDGTQQLTATQRPFVSHLYWVSNGANTRNSTLHRQLFSYACAPRGGKCLSSVLVPRVLRHCGFRGRQSLQVEILGKCQVFP